MFVPKSLILALSVCIVLPGAAVSAKPSMRDVPEIENIIFSAALAHEVSNNCPSLSARKFKALRMALKLRSRANKLGYTDSEIVDYIESDSEKARMRAKGETYLKAHGVKYGDPKTFCVFGHAEIANSSAVGALLKAK